MSIISQAQISAELAKPLTQLLNRGCTPVGGIYHLDFHKAVVLTDDFKKQAAGGVPEGGYLLAAAGRATDDGFVLSDQEVVLLRVRGTASLPHERDLIQLRLAVVRDAGSTGRNFDEVQDLITRDELQQSAFECDVLGTFYTKSDQPGADVFFGSDIDNVMVSARYQVYLPSSAVLSWVASFPEPTDKSEQLRIGRVRFAATERKAVRAATDQAAVKVRVPDFVGKKTAILGMSRAGKSNTIKTLVTAIHRYGSEHGQRIGQLIFDPQGEYANENEQDGTALHFLGDDDSTVRIYKVGPDPSKPKQKPLNLNFYDPEIFDVVWSLVRDATKELEAAYAQTFRSAEVGEPDRSDHSAWNRWSWARVGVYAMLRKCGYSGSQFASPIEVSLSKAQWDAFEADQPGAIPQSLGGKSRLTSPQQAADLAAFAAANKDTGKDANNVDRNGNPKPIPGLFEKWFDDQSSFKDIQAAISKPGKLQAALKKIKDFHNVGSSGDVSDNIWRDMVAGRLVIVDLSVGDEYVAKVMSERVVTTLLNRAGARFRNKEDLIQFQVVVEEAHNLFERGGREVSDDPWVRLSKEAAKYKVGLMYATQEVTSVDERILSNTSNWVIAHLNSDKQTRELAHYYDFAVWSASLIKSEEVGFVRMKTHSGKYIVPTQVDKFDHDMINGARAAAGLASTNLGDGDGGTDLPPDSAPLNLFSDGGN